MSNEMRKIINQFKEKSQLVEATDPIDVNTSVVTPPTESKNEMTLGDQLFNQGKYFDAYRQYKLAQRKEPDYFWAYFNAATSAYNARTRQSLQLVHPEVQKAQELLKNWQGGTKEKSAALYRLQTLLRSIDATT